MSGGGSSSRIEPDMTEMETIHGEKPYEKGVDDLHIAHGQQQVIDEESIPDLKEAEVLDAFGNEEGAEIQCV